MNIRICICKIFFISLHPILKYVHNTIYTNMNERDRILQVMQSEGMNAKQFCQEVGISQGTLSNILGGRNKPSLDVLQAVLRRFRGINCDWMIMGVGSMYLSGSREHAQPTLFEDEQEALVVPSAPSIVSPVANNVAPTQTAVRTVQKVMIFYSDGTFEER